MDALWYAIVAGMLAAYVALDGFDFGAGILHRFVARTDQERRTVLAAMNVEKIQKLIRLLSSPNDGEALAAVHALQRVLRDEGTYIHELAARIEGLSQAEMKKLYDAGFQEGNNAAAATTPDFSNVGPSFYEMAKEIRHKSDGRLNQREADFVDDMIRWCARREPSEKQARWLHVIYCRIGRRP